MASISTSFTIVTVKPRLRYHQNRTLSLKPTTLTKPLQFLHPPSFHFSKSLKPRTNSVLVHGTRASLDFPIQVKPGNIVETDKLSKDVRKGAMEAVDSLGGRVTIGDVASKSGLKLNVAEKALQALASDTGGFLEVSDEGDVLYVFPRDYRSKLAGKSFRLKVEPWLEKFKSGAEYVVRVSFGTALIASIVIVYTTIIAILTSSRDSDDRRSERRGGGRSFGSAFTFFRPSDLFWYWDPYYYRKRKVRSGGDDEMNFLESIFSFVFGDGDPNQGIEEERWKLIGQYIASNGGVVTPEELAPYLDVSSPMEGSGNEDESYILPVLLKFDGYPEVDEEGNILYHFPSLQKTATSDRSSRRKEYVGRKWTEMVGGVDKFFKERKWRFSNAGNSQRALAVGLGAFNLFGVIVLGTMLNGRASASFSSDFIVFVKNIFPALQIYAASFFVIPLLRWFFLRKTNAEIEKRNRAREERARVLELPDLELRRKLLSARDMAQQTVIGRDRIVYSTDKDLTDQDYEAREWERKFRETE